jgi:tetratricopeptide (TPR) repeat protein
VKRPSVAPLALVALAAALVGAGCRAVATGRNVDGVRYFQQGQYPVALQRFDAALTIDPRNPDSYYNKGAVLHRTGITSKDQNALAQAESLYRQCLDYNPNHVDCHRALAVLLTETGRIPEAFDGLKGWAAQNPTNSDARVELARLYEEYGDQGSANFYLTEALTINSRDWRAHAALGRLKEQNGDLAQALQNYQRAYELNRFQPQLEQRIAELNKRAPTAAPGSAPGTTLGSTPPLPTAPRSAAGPRPYMRY